MKRFIGLLMVASALGACSGNKSKAGETQPATASLPVKATMGEGFSLTAASDFLVDIEGCVTMHTAQLTQADSSAVLFPGDHNCVAKLKSFSVSGVSYIPSSSSPDFSLSQQLIYEGTDGSHLMVTVSKQLPATLSLPAGEDCLEVEFRYNGITKGVSKDIITGIGAKALVLGDVGSYFKLIDGDLLSVVSSGASAGHGMFDFTLECLSGDTHDECMDLLSSGQLQYKLLKDTYNGTMTLAEAMALNPFSFQAISGVGPISFKTSSLEGPGVLGVEANRKMILVFKIGNSYQYFPVTLKPVCNGCKEGHDSNPNPNPNPSATECSVSYTSGGWGGSTSGATINIGITNTGAAAISGWTLDVVFANDQTVFEAWRATYVQTGNTASFTNESFNTVIAAGATEQLGFNINFGGINDTPTAFILNGVACSVQN